MQHVMDLMKTSISKLAAIPEDLIVSTALYGEQFSMIIDRADELSPDQTRALAALGDDLGLGKVKMIPAIEGIPPKYEFEGPMSDLKHDMAIQHLNALRKNRATVIPPEGIDPAFIATAQGSTAWDKHRKGNNKGDDVSTIRRNKEKKPPLRLP